MAALFSNRRRRKRRRSLVLLPARFSIDGRLTSGRGQRLGAVRQRTLHESVGLGARFHAFATPFLALTLALLLQAPELEFFLVGLIVVGSQRVQSAHVAVAVQRLVNQLLALAQHGGSFAGLARLILGLLEPLVHEPAVLFLCLVARGEFALQLGLRFGLSTCHDLCDTEMRSVIIVIVIIVVIIVVSRVICIGVRDRIRIRI
mmetsp:Transcript_5857/g.14945  ORF Transcript_5857/g.14945 Transcript_5857/m.14945 type:complete len:203 (-) Transcript_5857:553-1161(-)